MLHARPRFPLALVAFCIWRCFADAETVAEKAVEKASDISESLGQVEPATLMPMYLAVEGWPVKWAILQTYIQGLKTHKNASDALYIYILTYCVFTKGHPNYKH